MKPRFPTQPRPSAHRLIASVALVLVACSDDSPSGNTAPSFAGGSLGASAGAPVRTGGLGGAGSQTPATGGGPGAGGKKSGGGTATAPAPDSRGGTGSTSEGAAGGSAAADSAAGAGGLGPSGGAGGSTNGGANSGGNASGGGSDASGGSLSRGGDTAGGSNSAPGGTTSGGGSDASSTAPPTIWLAGDSTVANGKTPCPRGWGRSLESKFESEVTVVNSAVGGRSVRTWLYSVTKEMGNDGECVLNKDGNGKPILQERWTTMLAKMVRGDTLLIQFGINDGSRTCDRHVGTQKFKEEYAMMARAARERGAEPIFITPVSAVKCSGSKAVGTRGFLQATREVAKSENVPIIDLHQRSIDLYNKRKFCPLPSGNSDVSASTKGAVGEFFCDDHTHFSDLGQPAIADLVVDGLKELEVPLVDHLK